MNARGNPAAAGPSARWKRVGVGCLAVLGVGGILGLVAAGVFVKTRYPWFFELGQAGQEAIKRGKSNPAVQELNRTLCGEALLFSAEEVSRFQRILKEKSSQDAHAAPPPFRWVLSCRPRDAAHPPGCDRVAQAFHHASTEREPFVVVVATGLYASGKMLCTALYDEQGKPVRHVQESEGTPRE
jgi:hypothetical protein